MQKMKCVCRTLIPAMVAVLLGLTPATAIHAQDSAESVMSLTEQQAAEAGFEFDAGEGAIYAYSGAAKSITIPSRIGGQPVTVIGDSAFNNKGLTRVTIPDSVTSIGNGAFRYNQLTRITIPGSVASIGNGAFRYNQLTRVTIPGSVASIGNGAFWNNQLTRVTIGANVDVTKDPFGRTLANVYNRGGRAAGTYTRNGSTWTKQ
jgi:hypothetical protein